MKRILSALAATAVLLPVVGLLVLPQSVFAYPLQYNLVQRNSDDTDFANVGFPLVSTSTPHIFGGRLNSDGLASFYIGNGLRVDTASTPLNPNNYVVSVDLGAWSPLDVGNLGDLLDAKVSTTTYTSGIATLQGQLNTLSLPSQVQSDFATTSSSSPAFVKNKPSVGVVYEGTTQRTGAFPIFKSATVGSGIATFYLTADNTSSGTALCTNGVVQDSVSPTVSDALASYQMSWAFTNSNKTLTVTANKLTTANILTGILGQATANGSVVKLSVWCY